ncbi:hypothetical protein [Palleronia caenipelagi]|nr:hypothetical protein [Palleronia caenipelagi]
MSALNGRSPGLFKLPLRQTAEIHIRIALMNRFNALGTNEIVSVA